MDNLATTHRYSPDGRLIASCSDDKTVNIYDSASLKKIHSVKDPKGFPQHLDFHPLSQSIGVATSDSSVSTGSEEKSVNGWRSG